VNAVEALLEALDFGTIARKVERAHDEARMTFRLHKNTVDSWAEFEDLIGDYYLHHFSRCVSKGASLPDREARSRAKEILGRAFRGASARAFYVDAQEGTNGGARVVLDKIADGLKQEAVMNYVRDQFDHFVDPTDWDCRVEIIREFMEQCPLPLAWHIDVDRPERYASNYEELIYAYVNALGRAAGQIRGILGNKESHR